MSTEVTISWPSQPIAKFPADFLEADFVGVRGDVHIPAAIIKRSIETKR